MPASDLKEQLVKYLSDTHSTEENALTQLRAAVKSVEDEDLRTVLRQHLTETEEHERLIRERLDAHGGKPSGIKDIAQKATALVAGTIASVMPDTSGKIAIQSFAFEHLEIASYRMLREVAERAGDRETVAVATRILEQEEATAEKLGRLLEQVARADLDRMGVAA